MKLVPLPSPDLRRKKTLGHYYRPAERWWELSTQPRELWSQHRQCLNLVSVDSSQRESFRDGVLDAGIAQILDAGHMYWFTITERECDHATEHPHPAPPRRFLISQHGVIVVLATDRHANRLITAFRPDSVNPDNPDFPAAARSYVRRAAERRIHFRTSYSR